MGCACKNKQNKIAKLIPEMNMPTIDKKGIGFYLKGILSGMGDFSLRLILTILMIIISVPLIILFLISLLIFQRPVHITMPKKTIALLKKIGEKYG